jgi:hypothetical protein
MTNPTERLNRLYAVDNFLTATGYTNIPNIFESNPYWKDYDPRVGVAYDPFADHKTSIRAGFGIFHDPITLQAYQVGFGAAPPGAASTQIGTPSNPAIYPFPPTAETASAILPSQGIPWDWHIHSIPYMIQYNLNIQREVAAGTVLTVGYVGSHGVHLLTGQEQNPPTPVIDSNGVYHFTNAAGVPNPRLNPNLAFFTAPEPITTSRFNSLQATLNRRLTRSVQAQVSYTYSKCIDTGAFAVASFNGLTSTSARLENPFEQSIDRGPCSFDITQVLRVNGLAALPFHGNRIVEGWQISGIVSTYSGVLFNVFTGFDRAGFRTTTNEPRPNYVGGCDPYAGARTVSHWFNSACYTLQPVGTFGNTGRNSLRGPNFFNTDISISKDNKLTERLRLQFRAEFFNIFNHENLFFPNSMLFSAPPANDLNREVRNASAGRITASNPGSTPRQIQFGVKLNF